MEQDVDFISENVVVQYDELAQLTQEQGINVWGTDQEVLEEQALHELNVLSQVKAEEIDETPAPIEVTLDINSYLKKQEELRKIQEYKKTLQVDENKSKIIADRINKKIKTKRKLVVKASTSKKAKLEKKQEQGHSSGSEYLPSDGPESDHEVTPKTKKIRVINNVIERQKDDGSLDHFKKRLELYYQQSETEPHIDDDLEAPDFYTIKGGLKIPLKIWNGLYSYQQDGVRWLWAIHRQNTGCILGDEMGLGKTVQMIAFLAGLEYTQLVDGYKGLGPTLIVCPVTVIHQWVQHFHQWAPEFRVAILHKSGGFVGEKPKLIEEINKNKGILVTNYTGVLKHIDTLVQFSWHYVILDEGHKIRNPNAKASVAVKKIRTSHRVILTGSPMQNNLQELWSLFDFTNPGMLGNLPTFMEHFNGPIVQGGFVNATSMQEATALQVATTLKNIITPFLLRRSKISVQEHISLPNKTEQVLFCSLTDVQRDLYKGYLMSDRVHSILGNAKNWFADNSTRGSVFVSITTLRKICNHPDIYLYEPEEVGQNEDFGFYKKSGKMVVVSALLKIWKKQGHRVLLFTQSRRMLLILEGFLKEQGYKYLKMSGNTAVTARQPLINKFNQDSSFDVFLLTTRVGGLGVNLTGANRVIIYDPDWNPAVDTQARERAWRIGQDKQVTIYRLLSAGTIEEKMYQRQVWKQLLGNKVLLDPKTQKFFKSSSLHDLFSLPEDNKPETTNIFRESRVKFQEQMSEKKQVEFTKDKIQAMKNLAQQIAKSIKTPEQKKLEQEPGNRLEEKEKLKQLMGAKGNTVDDCETGVSFASALEITAQTSQTYHKRKKKKKNKDIFKSVVDKTGVVDGEKVDGLVKTEIKKVRKKYEKCQTGRSVSQDQYVLEKLFARKGVSGALQHESVVGGPSRTQSLRVQTEAKLRADKALEALRKSRLSSWRW